MTNTIIYVINTIKYSSFKKKKNTLAIFLNYDIIKKKEPLGKLKKKVLKRVMLLINEEVLKIFNLLRF